MKMTPHLRKLACLGLLPLLIISLHTAHAGSATWNLNPTSGDWNTATNWMPNTIPNSAQDTATFGVSNLTAVFLHAPDTVKGITFNPGASAYTITVGPNTTSLLTITGVGITNNSGVTQNFITTNSSSPVAAIEFRKTATAGSGVFFTNNGGPSAGGGATRFFDTASAGDATFLNIGGSSEGSTEFYNNATAGNGTFTNGENSTGLLGGRIIFSDDSTAGNGFFTNEGKGSLGGNILFQVNATAGTGTFINQRGEGTGGAIIQFIGTTSADHGTFTFQGANTTTGGASHGDFLNSSTADEAVFTLESGLVSGKPGGLVIFHDTATAANSTLIANSGPGTNSGGTISFLGDSDGGTARVEVLGGEANGSLLLDSHNAPGITIGSLEGSGTVTLGAHNLTVGGNDLSTTFSGVIRDGGSTGSVTKTGTGTLTLSGANSYLGTTTVNDGVLLAGNTTGSATGTGTVLANAGTVGGGGTIAGALTVGTGSGSGAFLAPAAGTNKKATLTTLGTLTLKADATYTYTAKAKGRKAQTDKVVAKGVTISGASFSFQAQVQGTLQAGTALTVISNSAATPISGTFANLADGAIITVNGNNLQADYEGGDGNDLTLTVIP